MADEEKRRLASERTKAWQRANPERARELKRRSYLRNRAKVLARSKEWTENNPEETRQRKRAFYDRNKEAERERLNALSERFKQTQPERYRENNRLQQNKRRARELASEGSFTQAEWSELCERFDFRCLRCGEKKPLTPDHIRPLSKGGSNFISNIQPLCFPCNASKGNRHETDYRIGV
jgi:5-methylcytosine-specific restriction endonuclease McrA